VTKETEFPKFSFLLATQEVSFPFVHLLMCPGHSQEFSEAFDFKCSNVM